MNYDIAFTVVFTVNTDGNNISPVISNNKPSALYVI